MGNMKKIDIRNIGKDNKLSPNQNNQKQKEKRPKNNIFSYIEHHTRHEKNVIFIKTKPSRE